MKDWLDPLRNAFDHLTRQVEFFFRDDDAGWSDERLFDLLDIFDHLGLPIDVAAIPKAVTPSLAHPLLRRMEGVPHLIGIHQHGYSHDNHESEGRKCEFGPARTRADQRKDIDCGRHLLADLFKGQVEPIFTPPWNRCTQLTGECLVELGFEILSRESETPSLGIPHLKEMPIHVDWFAKHKGTRLEREEWVQYLIAKMESTWPVGIMFHHAVMDACEFDAVDQFLSLMASHSQVKCRRILSSRLV